ncbi:preprotein translocase subunit SecE [Amphibiibacter pelophylacis]|uniref:Preprotein translocase subunit SecE n=1 Tax=Amphibiibacter pelophylacis TaxID=1799477 RepID=A0ACC6NY70_9BURK
MANVTEAQTVTPGKEKFLLVMVAVWVILGVGAYYVLASQPGWQRVLSFLAGLVLAAATFFYADAGRRLVGFARDSWKEVGKMVWPKRNESLQLTGYVFAFVLVVALYLWLSDKIVEFVLYRLILGWTQ